MEPYNKPTNKVLSFIRGVSLSVSQHSGINIVGQRKSLLLQPSKEIPYVINESTVQTKRNGNTSEQDGTTVERENITVERDNITTERDSTIVKLENTPPQKNTGTVWRKVEPKIYEERHSGWKSFKNLLHINPCDQYRCPKIKERLEIHQKESHAKHRGTTKTTLRIARSKNSRVSIRSGPEYDQFSDQTFPKGSISSSTYNINTDNSINDKMNDNNKKGCFSKCHTPPTCKKLKGNLTNKKYELSHSNQASESKSDKNSVTITHNINMPDKNETDISVSKTYVDNYTIPSNAKDAITDISDWTDYKDFNAQEQPENYVNHSTSPYNDDCVDKSEDTCSDSNDPQKPEYLKNHTTTYNHAYTGNIENFKCQADDTSKACRTHVDNIYSIPCTINDQIKNREQFQTQAPEQSRKYVNNCSLPYDNVNINENNDACGYYSEPKKLEYLKNYTTTYRQAFTNTADVNSKACATQMDNVDSCSCNRNDGFNKSEMIDRPTYTEVCTTTYRDAYTDPTDAFKFPLVPLSGNIVQTDNKTYAQLAINFNGTNNMLRNQSCSLINFNNTNKFDRQVNDHINSCAVQVDDDHLDNPIYTDDCTMTYSDAYTENEENLTFPLTETPTNVEMSTTCGTDKINYCEPCERFEKPPCHMENADRNTLYSYKKVPYALDDVYNICSSNTNLGLESFVKDSRNNRTNKLIYKEVKEWIHEIPLYDVLEKDAIEYYNNLVNNLILNLSKLSRDTSLPGYDEKVKNEIDLCLNQIPFWYPGAKREQAGYKRNLVDRLFLRIKALNKQDVAVGNYSVVKEVSTSLTSCDIKNSQIRSKNLEIKTCITEWLRSIHSISNNVMDSQIPELVDFVTVRVNPLLNIPVNSYNHKIILKSAIVNIISDLPGAKNNPRLTELETYNFAKELADSLLCIQAKYVVNVAKAGPSKTLKNNSYFESNDRKEIALCSEIKKNFELVNIACDNNLIVEETAVILLDCFEVPDPEAANEAKQEIITLLTNSSHLSEEEASQLTKVLMRKAKKVLNEEYGPSSKKSHIFGHPRKPCTVLVCTLIKEASPLNYYLIGTRKNKLARKVTSKHYPLEIHYNERNKEWKRNKDERKDKRRHCDSSLGNKND